MANHFLSMPLWCLLASGSLLLASCGGGGGSTKSQAVPIEEDVEKYHIDEFVANYYLEKCIDAGINAELKSEKDRGKMISDFTKNLSVDELVELRRSGELEDAIIFHMELHEFELFHGARKCIDSHKARLEKGMAIACNILPKYKYLKVDGSSIDYDFCLKAADETMYYFRFRRIFDPNVSIAEVKKVLYEKLDEYITNETASEDSEENNTEVVIEDTGKTDGNGKWILKDGIVELVFPETDGIYVRKYPSAETPDQDLLLVVIS